MVRGEEHEALLESQHVSVTSATAGKDLKARQSGAFSASVLLTERSVTDLVQVVEVLSDRFIEMQLGRLPRS